MIELKNVEKTYGAGDTAVHALKGISLTINDGEMAAIIGASGSGKSTLLNLLGLLDNKYSGSYFLNGNDARKLSESKRAALRNKELGFVLQDFALIEHYSVKENIMLPLRYSKEKPHDAEGKIGEVLLRLGIAHKLNSPVNKLSGGQRQRVAIARAIINNPRIILADEPTGALDSKSAAEIMGIFRELNAEGRTVIIVTHDIGVARQCGRIIEISDGVIIPNKNE
ncbi:MAG: ABC transporter ATP-binding protein [Oscillospiraceae bacterium]